VHHQRQAGLGSSERTPCDVYTRLQAPHLAALEANH
jgi:hypothetical protein